YGNVAGVRVVSPVRHLQRRHEAIRKLLQRAGAVSLAECHDITVADGEDDANGLELDDGGEHAGTWPHQVAARYRYDTDPTSYRRDDACVAECELRRLHCRLGCLKVGVRPVARCRRIVKSGFGRCSSARQLSRARETASGLLRGGFGT